MRDAHHRQKRQPTAWKRALPREFGAAIRIVVRRALRRRGPETLLDCRIRRLAYELFPNDVHRLRDRKSKMNLVVEQVSIHICQAIFQGTRQSRSTEIWQDDTIQQAFDIRR